VYNLARTGSHTRLLSSYKDVSSAPADVGASKSVPRVFSCNDLLFSAHSLRRSGTHHPLEDPLGEGFAFTNLLYISLHISEGYRAPT
jgi:hypothetical protein